MCYHTPGLLGNFQLTVTFSLYIYLQDLQIFSFSVNNITEKLMKVSAWFWVFFSIFLAIQNWQLNPAMYVKNNGKAITDVKKSTKATADVQPLKINFDNL